MAQHELFEHKPDGEIIKCGVVNSLQERDRFLKRMAEENRPASARKVKKYSEDA